MPATSDLEREDLQDLLRRLADRKRVRSEATIQADVRQILLTGGLDLAEHDLEVHLEAQVGNRRRIDIEVGYTVIEVKKSLTSEAVVRDAEIQLGDYIAMRMRETGQQYVGILTDGAEWRAYRLHNDVLKEVTTHVLKTGRPDLGALLSWLEGVLATRQNVPPTPFEIRNRLGADSASYMLDRASLHLLYEEHEQLPTVQLKRQLWSQLLGSALGTQFTDDTDLFLEHTLLVNSAEIIAHLVLGFDVASLQPASLLSGEHFKRARISGVVEQDFFDWVLEVPGGDSFVRSLARRLARFDWRQVNHDVLKVLYESIIGTETRVSLGEYYTPDWLAERIVSEAVTNPLGQRVLDPSCGSGTFLFHAVRRYLTTAEQHGLSLADALEGLTRHVYGLDLHPVAVALARVTYVLAIGPERLTGNRRGIHVPVYLGDSMQWRQENVDLFTGDNLVISTTGDQLFGNELNFPEGLLDDVGRFDTMILELTALAGSPRATGTVPSLVSLFNRMAIEPQYQDAIKDSFRHLCHLHDIGRNHIWSYYVRNLARPMWLSRPKNRVDVMVGNPPWLAYRRMPKKLQERFRELCEVRGLWHGREVATHQDLSGLFVARTVQQFLSTDGKFAFVLPNAALDRGYFGGFRSGHYADPSEVTTVEFTGSWDLRRLRPHFFPRGGSVVFGRRTGMEDGATPLPASTIRWTGRLPKGSDTWDGVAQALTLESATLARYTNDLLESPYKPRFLEGATITPRVVFMIIEQPAGPLGLPAGRADVVSERSSTEKEPWKFMPAFERVVESEFVWPALLGESILPYRVLPPRKAVIPLVGDELLDGDNPRIDMYPDLASWWRKAEKIWHDHRSSERLTLTERLNFRKGLTGQFPAAPLRVVYAKSGMHISAALVDDPTAVIDHTLYWGTVASRSEGYFLCAILNSPELTDLVRPLMSYGKDERHIDKHVWKLPIPLYDPSNEVHARLATLGGLGAGFVAALDLDESKNFVSLRQDVRKVLAQGPYASEVDELVVGLLDQ
ncbi:N-6 DNA methylase [Nonomuraea spiralis]|uniref:N-6 DNA methylase n=1 Tax=Nonomuraea spiralis TaxID=46182 RepID=A0ABV5IQH8_9ACTN|nr:N-6 DNA methylase [Nonomuraea spiralis]GGT37622.1 BseRI endonuclease [Nonomuraea spiralis]